MKLSLFEKTEVTVRYIYFFTSVGLFLAGSLNLYFKGYSPRIVTAFNIKFVIQYLRYTNSFYANKSETNGIWL